MGYSPAMENKSDQVMVRLKPSERKRLMAAAKDLGITVSEFVRACINRELAMSLDPAAIDALSKTFEKGMREVVGKIVDTAIEQSKAKHR